MRNRKHVDPTPPEQARLIIKTYGGHVFLDVMLDAGSTSTIRLPDNQVQIASVKKTP